MFATIHLRDNITLREMDRELLWITIFVGVAGMLFVHRPLAAAACMVVAVAAVCFGLLSGSVATRTTLFVGCAATGCLVVWCTSLWFSAPVPGTPAWEILIEHFGVAFSCAGAFCLLILIAFAIAASTSHRFRFALKHWTFRFWAHLEMWSIGILLALSIRARPSLPVSVIVLLSLLVASHVWVTAAYGRYLRSTVADLRRTHRLVRALAAQGERFRALSEQLCTVRRVRHDLNSHLMVMASLVREGRRADARAYLDSLADPAYFGEGEGTALAAALIRSRVQFLETNGVQVHIGPMEDLPQARRISMWPWAELMVDTAERTLGPGGRFKMLCEAGPSVLYAEFSPARYQDVRGALIFQLQSGPRATVSVGLTPDRKSVCVRVLVPPAVLP